MSKVAISIIMPVYGVEEYVGKAIESIQAQTFGDWELWAVDDGTRDRSGIICDEYAAKDPRIHVVHKENGGAPSARNLAIDQAEGKYFYFMDSDDWAEPTMLEDMYRLAEGSNAEMVVAGYYIDSYYSDTEKYVQIQQVEDRVFEDQKDFRQEAYRLFDQSLLYTPWNKLFLAEYIKAKKLYFPNTFWDDFPFCLSVVRDVERVAVTSTPYYHFIRKRADSETARYRKEMYEKREEENGWMVDLFEYWKIDGPEVREFLARRYVERLIGCIENVTNASCTLNRAEKRDHVRRIISTDAARNGLKLARPHSFYMKIMLLPLKWKNVSLCLLEGMVISKVKRSSVKRFVKLKANR